MKRKKQKKLNLKIGDTVKVISGFEKDEIGEVQQIDKKTGRIIVSGINLKFKHFKPTAENKIGEIKKIEGPIHHSNVRLNVKQNK